MKGKEMYTKDGQEVLVRHENAGEGFMVVPALETWDGELVEEAERKDKAKKIAGLRKKIAGLRKKIEELERAR